MLTTATPGSETARIVNYWGGGEKVGYEHKKPTDYVCSVGSVDLCTIRAGGRVVAYDRTDVKRVRPTRATLTIDAQRPSGPPGLPLPI
jgi:hypothetical protein